MHTFVKSSAVVLYTTSVFPVPLGPLQFEAGDVGAKLTPTVAKSNFKSSCETDQVTLGIGERARDLKTSLFHAFPKNSHHSPCLSNSISKPSEPSEKLVACLNNIAFIVNLTSKEVFKTTTTKYYVK